MSYTAIITRESSLVPVLKSLKQRWPSGASRIPNCDRRGMLSFINLKDYHFNTLFNGSVGLWAGDFLLLIPFKNLFFFYYQTNVILFLIDGRSYNVDIKGLKSKVYLGCLFCWKRCLWLWKTVSVFNWNVKNIDQALVSLHGRSSLPRSSRRLTRQWVGVMEILTVAEWLTGNRGIKLIILCMNLLSSSNLYWLKSKTQTS